MTTNSDSSSGSSASTAFPALTKLDLLRALLRLDAAVLLMLGLFLMLVPKRIEVVFQFKDFSAGYCARWITTRFFGKHAHHASISVALGFLILLVDCIIAVAGCATIIVVSLK